MSEGCEGSWVDFGDLVVDQWQGLMGQEEVSIWFMETHEDMINNSLTMIIKYVHKIKWLLNDDIT